MNNESCYESYTNYAEVLFSSEFYVNASLLTSGKHVREMYTTLNPNLMKLKLGLTVV